MSNDEVASILARGRTVRLSPGIGAASGAVMAALGVTFVAAGRAFSGHGLAIAIAAALVLAVVAVTWRMRQYVTIVAGTMRWRFLRTHEVSLLDVLAPRREKVLFNDRLVVSVKGRRDITFYARDWGTAALNSLQECLEYNVRVVAPRAREAARAQQIKATQ